MRARRPARSFVLRVKWRVTLLLALALAITLSILAFSRPQEPIAGGIALWRGEHIVAQIGRAELLEFEMHAIEVDGAKWDAVPLMQVLDAYGAQPTFYEQIAFRGETTHTAQGAELLGQDTLYIALAAQGEPDWVKAGEPYLIDIHSGLAIRRLDSIAVQLLE